MGLKGVCDTFLSPLRWSAERRTTTPVPSSKEGNYGEGGQRFLFLAIERLSIGTTRHYLFNIMGCLAGFCKGGSAKGERKYAPGGGENWAESTEERGALAREGENRGFLQQLIGEIL